MKNLRLLLYCLLFTVHYSLSAQQSIGFTKKSEAKNEMVNGQKEGKWIEYLAAYADVVESDTNKAYYYQLSEYKQGKPDGIVRMYFRDGTLARGTPYTMGNKNGVAKLYYHNGKIMSEKPYKADSLDGIEKWYHENGNPMRYNPYS